MKAKLSLIIHSHLSDIQTGFLVSNDVNNKINFVKWLILKHSDLNAEINLTDEWEAFMQTRFFVRDTPKDNTPDVIIDINDLHEIKPWESQVPFVHIMCKDGHGFVVKEFTYKDGKFNLFWELKK